MKHVSSHICFQICLLREVVKEQYRWICLSCHLLIAIIIISFIMVDLSPINPVKTYISNMIVSPEQVAALEAYWGVNEPITAKIMN